MSKSVENYLQRGSFSLSFPDIYFLPRHTNKPSIQNKTTGQESLWWSVCRHVMAVLGISVPVEQTQSWHACWSACWSLVSWCLSVVASVEWETSRGLVLSAASPPCVQAWSYSSWHSRGQSYHNIRKLIFTSTPHSTHIPSRKFFFKTEEEMSGKTVLRQYQIPEIERGHWFWGHFSSYFEFSECKHKPKKPF